MSIELIVALVALVLASLAAWRSLGNRQGRSEELLARLVAQVEALPDKIRPEDRNEQDEALGAAVLDRLEALKEATLKTGVQSAKSIEDSLGKTFGGLQTSLDAVVRQTVPASGDPAWTKSLAGLPGAIADLGAKFEALGQGLSKSTQETGAQLAKLPEAFSGMGAKLDNLRQDLSGSSHEAAGIAASLKADLAATDAARTQREVESLAQLQEISASLLALQSRVVASVELSGRSIVSELAPLRQLGSEISRIQLDIQPVVEAVSALQATIHGLPLQIAQESAKLPAPMPELEELAMAVRDAGSLRGDAVRSVADAVSNVSQQLSARASAAEEARETSTLALQSALESLREVSESVSTSLAPLAGALDGHAQALQPLADSLKIGQQAMEEAGTTFRANQVEFSASVGLFTRAAQELSGGLSAFAREGEAGQEDPRIVLQAFVDSLQRLLDGFSTSLKAVLAESDLRSREIMVELAERLPVGAVEG